MPSVKRKLPLARSAAVVACIGLLGAGAAGCSTTQEKAAAHQAESERILDARAERQKQRKKGKGGRQDKSNSHDNGGNKQ